MFKVGEKVRVRKDIREIKSNVGTTLEMCEMAGQYVTIADIGHHTIGKDYWYYFIIEDDGDYYWDDTLLEKVGVTLR